jgi:GNAT superfamily N-acetyltransferase
MRGKSALQIVRASSAHVERLVPLFEAYREFYKQSPDPAAARQYLQERLDRDESVVFLAIRTDSEEGLGFTLLYHSYSSLRMRSVYILHDLYVVPARRRQGIGRALMETAHQFALRQGAHRVSLATAVDNLAGQRLYQSLGYQRDEDFFYYDLTL